MIAVECPWCHKPVEVEGFAPEDFPAPNGGWPYRDCRCPECGQSFRAKAMCGCRVKAIPIIDQPRFTGKTEKEGESHDL